jgi:hypothetical protein
MTIATIGLDGLSIVQFGHETVPGTAVAATKVWNGKGVIQDDTEIARVNAPTGYLYGINSGRYISKQGATLELESTEATFEQLCYFGEWGEKALLTGVADGAGAGKIYTYPFATTAQQTITTATFETGDNIKAKETEHCFLEKWSLSGKQGEAVMCSGTIRGRRASNTTLTGSLAHTVAEPILMGNSKLYINAVSSAYGTTQVTATMLEFAFERVTGWKEIMPTGDGALYYPGIKCAPDPSAENAKLDITFEHESQSIAEEDLWLAQTSRAIQLKFEGTAITAGTAYSKKTVILNLPGYWSKFEKFGPSDGNNKIKGTFITSLYDVTLTNAGSLIVVNTLATI